MKHLNTKQFAVHKHVKCMNVTLISS